MFAYKNHWNTIYARLMKSSGTQHGANGQPDGWIHCSQQSHCEGGKYINIPISNFKKDA